MSWPIEMYEIFYGHRTGRYAPDLRISKKIKMHEQQKGFRTKDKERISGLADAF